MKRLWRAAVLTAVIWAGGVMAPAQAQQDGNDPVVSPEELGGIPFEGLSPDDLRALQENLNSIQGQNAGGGPQPATEAPDARDEATAEGGADAVPNPLQSVIDGLQRTQGQGTPASGQEIIRATSAQQAGQQAQSAPPPVQQPQTRIVGRPAPGFTVSGTAAGAPDLNSGVPIQAGVLSRSGVPFPTGLNSQTIITDTTIGAKAPPPPSSREVVRMASPGAQAFRSSDAKDLGARRGRAQTRIREGLACQPANLRLEEVDFATVPNTYRLIGHLEAPTEGYTYEVQPTAQRSSFLRASGGPGLMSMTLSMKRPEVLLGEPNGIVRVDELVTVAPNTLRLDVVVNNVIFRRNDLYYCRIPGTLD